MTDLLSSVSLRDVELPNRIVVSPMCQYSCEPDGIATEWHRVHLGSRAVGGAGIVMTEATAVDPIGRITPHDLGIWSDEHAAALEPITEFVRDQGGVPGIQLAHAGHKASKERPWEGHVPIQPDGTGPSGASGWEVLTPSPEAYPPFDGDRPAMRKADQDDIEGVIDAYRGAAERSLEAGFEIVEIHAAHGYLFHEFLSPVTNHREDDYGGSFENRTRLLREVVQAVREVWPDDKPLFVRLSGTDWLDDRESWDIDQTVRLADNLAALGVDLIDVSSGGLHPEQTVPGGPNFQVPLAERVRDGADVAVGTVGGVTEPEQADALIRNGRADLVFVGREFLRDPYFGLRAVGDLERDSEAVRDQWPAQYRRSVQR
ncbi:NADH:flavin oxidoreductase/NADH oxidase [Natrinema ejinorense]|uniref:NADH:flavin oxidoreductase / NADH oxidase n=1 Tax=Natrinema ejinorense TaxID=373386 RepID=A0A2A5QV96_9EURY|nr:NADH:flavin oxidoreductase/NADH oxidase [Natrinema ejinorense]PCR90766.1 NADH:flavin oxidoreductase / NADH oxidase [Natrinema ejinorense]